MAICKVMEGVGDNCFAPNQQITYAEWAKMICLTFYGHKMVEGTGDAWYADYIATVDSLGLFDKATNYDSANPYIPANRYDVAQIVYKVLTDKYVVWRQDITDGWNKVYNLGFGEFNINNYSSIITDWKDIPEAHKEAVARSYWAGILNGMEDGSYAGNTYLTRAQAAKILSKLAEVCNANATSGGNSVTSNPIYKKIKNGADRKDFVSSTPVKYVKRLTQLRGYEGIRENGEGGFILDPDARWDGCVGITLKTEGYSTIGFKVIGGAKETILEGWAQRTAGGIQIPEKYKDPNYNEHLADVVEHDVSAGTVLLEVIPANTTKEFTIDIAGAPRFVFNPYFCGAAFTITDIVVK